MKYIIRKVRKRLWLFICATKLINIDINFIICGVRLKIPDERGYLFSFNILWITFVISSCYGAGLHCIFRWTGIHIHLKKCIIYFDWKYSSRWWINVKYNWMLSKASKEELEKYINQLESMTK